MVNMLIDDLLLAGLEGKEYGVVVCVLKRKIQTHFGTTA